LDAGLSARVVRSEKEIPVQETSAKRLEYAAGELFVCIQPEIKSARITHRLDSYDWQIA
jgi:hypothetical protein